jgi:PPP family 3-phenylpropionic acid transporter
MLPRLMRDLRIQYALVFAMLGTVLPFASVYFRHRGFTAPQIGYAWAIWSGAITVSPVLVTMLADARIDPRRLLAGSALLAGAALGTLWYLNGVGAILGAWSVYCLTSMPVLPLLDGIHFSQERLRHARGEAPRPYPHVRVWGTIGYMVPAVLLLLGMMQMGMTLDVVLPMGAAFGAIAASQAFLIPDPRSAVNDTPEAHAADRRIPTADAARTLLRPNLLVFVVALLLLQVATSAHSGFYPIYLTERVKLDPKWIGPASILSVFVEMFFVFGSAKLMRRFGVKTLLVTAMVCTAARLGILASTSNAWTALGTQVFHGIFLIATGVIPPMVLNEAAEDRFRHSMQGLYVMIGGGGRALANLVAGQVEAWSLPGLFWIAAAISLAAGLLILLAFREPKHAREELTVADERPPTAAPVEGMATEAT